MIHKVSDATVLACAIGAALPPESGLAIVNDGPRLIVGASPEIVVSANGNHAFEMLDGFKSGWWAGFCTFDLGRCVERISPVARDDLGIADMVFARFDARVEIDPIAGSALVVGEGAGRHLLEAALAVAIDGEGLVPPPPALRGWSSSLERSEYEDRVATVLDHITAGDCYQVNLTRRLAAEGAPDAVALFAALARGNPAQHAALLRLESRANGAPSAIVSASPERFVSWQGTSVTTSPIKGTNVDPDELVRSAKDRAENVMIVDLARNDLGRVCVPGSIRVQGLCELAEHPGLWHLVSTVGGDLREDIALGGLLRATLPPASVTGAPKPAVMQIIEDLEPVRRGVYCGAIGWIDAEHARGDLAVAIRTFTIARGQTFLGVGAGIVADSDPRGEWDETELKAARLLACAGVADPAALDALGASALGSIAP